MHIVHGLGADLPFFLRFGHGPFLVQINLQHSQAQPLLFPNDKRIFDYLQVLG